MTELQMYLVGGFVRDRLLGVESKDVDFTIVADSYEDMRDFMITVGFEIFLETPQYQTIRARFPRGASKYAGIDVKGMTADFVYAREEGPYTDGRRPDWVRPGTLESDLSRRDFTVNALAQDWDGNVIDLFGGQEDLSNRLLRCVGEPEDRFGEDALRALRAIRFAVTKNMTMDASVFDALRSEWLPPLLASVSVERKAQELSKAFKHDTLETLCRLRAFPELEAAVFTGGLWLLPTLKS